MNESLPSVARPSPIPWPSMFLKGVSCVPASHQWTLSISRLAAATLHTSCHQSLHKQTLQDKVTVFYRWPTIRHFRFLSRCKLYQVALMGLLLPPATVSYHHGSLTGHTLTAAYVAAGGTLTLLISLSHLFTRVIGEMAYLPATDQVRVSTLTFLGGRRDIVVDPQYILPHGHGDERGLIQSLMIVGHRGTFRYSVHYGQVIDVNIMSQVLLHR